MITIYTMTYNEEVLIQFMIDHYRLRFPNCHIVAYDNMSTDKTVEILRNNNCEIIFFDTNNQIQDSKYLEIKNNCWKTAKTDWVLVCDTDELLDIYDSQLKKEQLLQNTIIKSEGYNMVNMEDNYDLVNIKYGVRAPLHDKFYLFNKNFIKEINYNPGSHTCNAIGHIKLSDKAYLAYHYKFINTDFMISRYKLFGQRLSDENKKNGWGFHYSMQENEIRSHYQSFKDKAIKLF